MQSFVCGTRLCFGADAPAALAGLHAERVLLVTDPYFAENGTAARYAAAFPGAQVEIFSDVAPDPPLSLVAQGVARLQALRPDTVLALGGGSAIDCAKGIAALGGLPVRLVAVPTTSGSGSEVTSFAILTQDGVKHPLVDPALRPGLSILDPALLEALPPRLIAESGMDAVSHCVEAAAAREASPVTDALAHSACRTLLRLLPRSFAGETAVRGDVHLAASMAALAFDNAGLGACHALAHALGGRFHVPRTPVRHAAAARHRPPRGRRPPSLCRPCRGLRPARRARPDGGDRPPARPPRPARKLNGGRGPARGRIGG